jgi:hypothetical protein
MRCRSRRPGGKRGSPQLRLQLRRSAPPGWNKRQTCKNERRTRKNEHQRHKNERRRRFVGRLRGILRSEMGNLRSERGNLTSEMGNLTSEMGNLTSEMGNLTSEKRILRSEMGNLISGRGNLRSEKGNLRSGRRFFNRRRRGTASAFTPSMERGQPGPRERRLTVPGNSSLTGPHAPRFAPTVRQLCQDGASPRIQVSRGCWQMV